MTKAERTELRSLIRLRFKVLRADVAARRAELQAEFEERLTAKYAAKDKAWKDMQFLIEEARLEANRKANDIIRNAHPELWGDDPHRDFPIFNTRPIAMPPDDRGRLRMQSQAQIEAQVKAALLELDRQEAELLSRLAVGALESDEAREFLGEIPAVSALVPADRLLALVGPIDGEVSQ